MKGEVKTIQLIPGQYQLADGLTKKEASRIPILEAIQKGRFMDNMICLLDWNMQRGIVATPSVCCLTQ